MTSEAVSQIAGQLSLHRQTLIFASGSQTRRPAHRFSRPQLPMEFFDGRLHHEFAAAAIREICPCQRGLSRSRAAQAFFLYSHWRRVDTRCPGIRRGARCRDHHRHDRSHRPCNGPQCGISALRFFYRATGPSSHGGMASVERRGHLRAVDARRYQRSFIFSRSFGESL